MLLRKPGSCAQWAGIIEKQIKLWKFLLLTPSCTRAFQECSSFLTNLKRKEFRTISKPIHVWCNAHSLLSLPFDSSGKHPKQLTALALDSLHCPTLRLPGLPEQLTVLHCFPVPAARSQASFTTTLLTASVREVTQLPNSAENCLCRVSERSDPEGGFRKHQSQHKTRELALGHQHSRGRASPVPSELLEQHLTPCETAASVFWGRVGGQVESFTGVINTDS